MTTKHTPGPWTVIESDELADHPFFAIAEPEGQSDAPDISIAIIEYSGNCYSPDTLAADKEKAYANARLIAAAPELLNALVAMTNIYEEIPGSEGDTLNSARAAIDKAKA